MDYPKKIKAVLQTGCIVAILFNGSAYMNPKPSQIEVLNQLIQVNIDRTAGYETASKEVKEEYLKKLFEQFANTSRICNSELELEVINLQGKPVEGTKTTLKIYQIWMNTKSMFTNHDIEIILKSCHHGETITKNVYDKVISQHKDRLNQQQIDKINNQMKLLKIDHDRVASLQNLMCVNH